MDWPRQSWKINPGPYANAAHRPSSINSAGYMRRDFPITAAMNQSLSVESEEEDSTKLTCNAFHNGNPILMKGSGELSFDDLDFEDMLGNKIDGWVCNVIYADDEDGPVQIMVNKDGSLEYDTGLADIPITSTETHVSTAKAQIPGGPVDGNLPESTSAGHDVSMSQITTAPHSADLEYHLRHAHRHHH
jgi:hypothetical protein